MMHSFGRWRYHDEDHTLELDDESYWIPLREIRSSAQMLDWIFQIAEKRWATPRVTHDLLTAFNALFYPQANLCSYGRDHRLPDDWWDGRGRGQPKGPVAVRPLPSKRLKPGGDAA